MLNFIALVVVNFQAYTAQGININDELAKSYNIGLATLSMLQISIAGVPLLVIVYNDPYAYSFVLCGIIFIVCTTILLLMFVPKIKRWKTWSAKKDKKKFTQGGSIQTSGSNVGGVVSDTSKILVSTGSNAETGSNVGDAGSNIKRQIASVGSSADAGLNVFSKKTSHLQTKKANSPTMKSWMNSKVLSWKGITLIFCPSFWRSKVWEGSSLSTQPMMKAAEKLNRKVECNDDKSVVSGH